MCITCLSDRRVATWNSAIIASTTLVTYSELFQKDYNCHNVSISKGCSVSLCTIFRCSRLCTDFEVRVESTLADLAKNGSGSKLFVCKNITLPARTWQRRFILCCFELTSLLLMCLCLCWDLCTLAVLLRTKFCTPCQSGYEYSARCCLDR